MTAWLWFVVGFGSAISIGLLTAIWVDVSFVESEKDTISNRVLIASSYRPAIACLITLLLTAPVFLLLGHFFFGQVVVVPQSIPVPYIVPRHEQEHDRDLDGLCPVCLETQR